VAGWVIAAAVLTLVAPNINDVAVSDQRSFLPSSAPSLDANSIVKKYFPDRVSASNAVVVVDAGKGGRADQGQAGNFVASLSSWISTSKMVALEDVSSPTMGDQQTKAAMISSDKQVAMILVRLNQVSTEPAAISAVAQIREQLRSAPSGVKTYLTGDAPIIGAYNESSKQSVERTTWITILLVICILLLIYRSVVSPLIPLTTIALAYLISRAVVAFLGAHVMTISSYTNVFLIVILFGAGTDYCLFLISRFREEMTDTPIAAAAAKSTLQSVGEVISSSAGTVIVGVGMMTATELGLYNTSGPSLAIGVAIALLAGLTLTPALLCILGARSFWPRKPHHIKASGFWHAWSGGVVKRPWLALVIPAIVLIPLAVYGSGLARDFDFLGDLSKNSEARVGFDVLSQHLGAGAMSPLNVVVVDQGGYATPGGLKRTEALVAAISKLENVALVRSLTGSISSPATLRVSDQLAVQAEAVRQSDVTLKRVQAGSGAQGSSQLDQLVGSAASGLTDVYGYLAQLAQSYPEVKKNSGYIQATNAMTQLASLAQAGGSSSGGASTGKPPTGGIAPSSPLKQELALVGSIADGLEILQRSFAPNPEAILLPNLYLKKNPGLKALRDAYISADGTASRLQIVLKSGPYGDEAMNTVQTLQRTLKANGYTGVVEGTSAVMLDLRQASNRDITRTLIYVLVGIFVVLLLLLRAVVAPVYLILTILLSYAATLGVVRLVFVDLLGAAGIVWWVPMFMFVMLVALGMDYNIFLIGRVKEEVAVAGTKDGARLALSKTGGIITSAGIIMAGTFASMMFTSLLGLRQIGFAVAFGVLLDTFVVRTTLVPAIVVLLRRWSWWPRKGPGRTK
jgi:RND superfamily putative drug exporter